MPGPVRAVTVPGTSAAAARFEPDSLSSTWIRNLRIARGNWRTIAGITAGAMLIGLAIYALQPPTWHAKSTLEVQGAADNILKAQDGDPIHGAEAEISDILTQVRILQSELLLNRTKARLRVPSIPHTAREKALVKAARTLVVLPVPQTRLITLAADSGDPQASADFVNTLADEYMAEHMRERWAGTERGTARLADAIADLHAQMERSQSALQQYARSSGILMAGDHETAAEERLRQLESAFSTAQAERVAKQSRLDAVEHSPRADLSRMIADPEITMEMEKLTDLRRELAGLRTTYTEDFPKVQKLQAQVAPLEASVAAQTAALAARLHSDCDEANRKEAMLAAAVRDQSAVVNAEAEKRVHYDVLKRDADSTRTLYDALFARVREASIAAELRASNVHVLDAAAAPVQPASPVLMQLLLLGCCAGAFLGSGFVLIREQARRTIECPGEIDLFLEVPEWAAVPKADALEGYRQAFRSLVASTLFASERLARRALVVTSVNPGEGKTTVAAELAEALAAAGKRVLLIDADLARPRLSERFGVAGRGLTEALASSDLFSNSIHPTRVSGLWLMPRGIASEPVAGLFHLARLAELFEYSQNNFDIVLADSPPLLQIPDARMLARAAGSVLLVVRAGRTTPEAALAVARRLAEDGAQMSGSVLNDWNPRRSPGYYGGMDSAGAGPAHTKSKAAVA